MGRSRWFSLKKIGTETFPINKDVVDAKISAPAAEKFPVVPSFPMESIDFALEAVTLGDEREFQR
jgi:hypothetical protein